MRLSPLYRRALEGHERQLGSEHPETLFSVNNLAHLLHIKGDLVGAELLYRRALEGFERRLGPDNPKTLSSALNLGVVLLTKGDLLGAEPLLRRALEVRSRKLGTDHHNTIEATHQMGVLLFIKGDLLASEPLLQPCPVLLLSLVRAAKQAPVRLTALSLVRMLRTWLLIVLKLTGVESCEKISAISESLFPCMNRRKRNITDYDDAFRRSSAHCRGRLPELMRTCPEQYRTCKGLCIITIRGG